MQRPVCYDVTRLLTRFLNATPNGIDRIDHALASHVLAGDPAFTYGATATGFGSRLLGGTAAAEAVAAVAAHWGEDGGEPDLDLVYARTVGWLRGTNVSSAAPPAQRRRRSGLDLPAKVRGLPGMARWALRHGVPLKTTPKAALPPHAVYLNASQFPLWIASSFGWLESRRDVRAAFFIHDLLPIQMPEYFRVAELERHRARMCNFARFGAAAIVTTQTVAETLSAHMATLGRTNLPIFVAPTPVSATFFAPRVIEQELGGHPYFVLCSTLEPRKNHLMILAVWRALVERLSANAPKLVLVGTRGWHYDSIVDLIGRSPSLRTHVLEVGGLSTPGLKRLIDNAQAVLMPSFGEGYGLPVHEALAAGAPVLASDIPVFREIAASGLTLISPLDGEAWLETIAALSGQDRPPASVDMPPSGWSGYFEALDGFLEAL